MSTSTKTPATIRQGGPGASHENAKSRSRSKSPRPTAITDQKVAFPAAEGSETATTRMILKKNDGGRPDWHALSKRVSDAMPSKEHIAIDVGCRVSSITGKLRRLAKYSLGNTYDCVSMKSGNTASLCQKSCWHS